MLLVTDLLILRKFNHKYLIVMDSTRIIAGLDVHKDIIILCIMGHDEAIIFQKKYIFLLVVSGIFSMFHLIGSY